VGEKIPVTWLPIARLLFCRREGDTASALREARTLAEQAPNTAVGVEGLSSVYMATGELDKARKLQEGKRAPGQ
jgi:Flp pilus assembly protein TadD